MRVDKDIDQHLKIEAPDNLKQGVLGALNIFNLKKDSPDEDNIENIKVSKVSSGIALVMKDRDKTIEYVAKDVFPNDKRWTNEDKKRRDQELTKTATVKALAELTGENLYWGSLEGVRPGNLYRLIRERGFNEEETEQIFNSIYGVNIEKIRLLRDLFEKQESILIDQNRSDCVRVSLYVGIPFCPTRCAYCSFAAYPLKSHGHLKKRYLEALAYEIKEIKSFFQSNNMIVDSVYMGGGTPTALTAIELDEVLSLLPKSKELTVEAGRPDTFDQEKVEVMKKAGVHRVSVNPQTLKEETLKVIGREHTVEQFFQAVDLVRKIGIPVLNIDLIAGLPGETAKDMEETLEKILALDPENVTLHTLAKKRASHWGNDQETWLKSSTKQTEAMVNLAHKRLQLAKLYPYYLYRQRHMAANLENIGYAKVGNECYYNIVMIEELKTVVGVGAGASTRFAGEVVSRLVNPKCPATYSSRVEDLVKIKKDNLAQRIGLSN